MGLSQRDLATASFDVADTSLSHIKRTTGRTCGPLRGSPLISGGTYELDFERLFSLLELDSNGAVGRLRYLLRDRVIGQRLASLGRTLVHFDAVYYPFSFRCRALTGFMVAYEAI